MRPTHLDWFPILKQLYEHLKTKSTTHVCALTTFVRSCGRAFPACVFARCFAFVCACVLSFFRTVFSLSASGRNQPSYVNSSLISRANDSFFFLFQLVFTYRSVQTSGTYMYSCTCIYCTIDNAYKSHLPTYTHKYDSTPGNEQPASNSSFTLI